MTTALYILVFALGSLLGAFLMYKFGKESITNEYKGTIKNKQRGRGNIQDNDNTAKMEINGGMNRREVIKIWRQLKKDKKT